MLKLIDKVWIWKKGYKSKLKSINIKLIKKIEKNPINILLLILLMLGIIIYFSKKIKKSKILILKPLLKRLKNNKILWLYKNY